MYCSRGLVLTILVLASALAGCQGEQSPMHPVGGTAAQPMAQPPTVAPPPAQPMAQPAAPPAVQAQIDRGRGLFAQHCASCHGAAGQGTGSAPAVLGAGSLPTDPPRGARVRRGRFQTAMDLGMFIKNEMPLGGQHLPPADVACVLAWLLKERGITPRQPISPSTAAAIRLR